MRLFGLLVAAMLALAAFAASPAFAATGDATVVIDDGVPCDISFEYDGEVPGSGPIRGITDGDCEFEVFVEGFATFNSDNTGDVTGTLTATVLGFIDCSYAGTLAGTWSGGPLPPNAVAFDVSGTVIADPDNSGLCPAGPLVVDMTGTLQP